MEMDKTPCDMCKGCLVPKTMEELDPYEGEYYFSCSDCACYGCADLHSCTGKCINELREVN